MTVIDVLEKRIELQNAELANPLKAEERSEILARIAEDRNLILILTANKQIKSVE